MMHNHKLRCMLLFAIGLFSCNSQPPATLTQPTTVQLSPVSTATETLILSPNNGFKVSVTTETAEGVSARIAYILEEKVVEMEADSNVVSVIYDLRQKSWRDLETKKTTTFLNCLSQVRGQVRNLKTSFATEKDEDLKEFALGILEPKFELETGTQGELIFQNDFIEYTITPAQHLAGEALASFLVYDQLNACHDVLISKGVFTFSRLTLADELVSSPIFPSEILLIRRGLIGESVSRTFFSIGVMTSEETQMVKSELGDN